jgi:hypothetical protein
MARHLGEHSGTYASPLVAATWTDEGLDITSVAAQRHECTRAMVLRRLNERERRQLLPNWKWR